MSAAKKRFRKQFVIEKLEARDLFAADLYVLKMDAPSSATAGSDIVVGWREYNGGNVAAASHVDRFQGKNSALQTWLDQDVFVPSIAAGGSTYVTTTAHIPANVSLGTQGLYLVTDRTNNVPQSNTANDFSSTPITIVAPSTPSPTPTPTPTPAPTPPPTSAAPDLYFTSVTAPTSMTAGSTYQLTANINNAGGYAASTVTRVQAKDASGRTVIDFDAYTAPIAAGSSAALTVNVTFPTGTTPGAWTFYLTLDRYGSIGQSNTGNDFGSTPVNVVAPASTPTPTPAAWTSTATSTGNRVGSAINVTVQLNAPVTTANGVFDVEIFNASGTRVYQSFVDSQNIPTGQSSRTISWVPSAPGSYRVTDGEFGAGWSPLLHWNDNLLTLTVGSAASPMPTPTPTVWNATATSTGAQAGSPMKVNVSLSAPVSVANGILDLEFRDAAGNRVAQKFLEGQNILAGQSNYSFVVTAPAAGVLTGSFGVFGPNWSPLDYWNNQLLSVTVPAASSPTPSPMSVSSVSPATIYATDGRQNITITGTNFDPDTGFVVMYDPAGNQYVLNGDRVLSRSATSITVNPDFTSNGVGGWVTDVVDNRRGDWRTARTTIQVKSPDIIGTVPVPTPRPTNGSLSPITVTLHRVDGTHQILSGSHTTWVVIHGREDSANSTATAKLATELGKFSANDQVLTLDWSGGARDNSDHTSTLEGEGWIPGVAQWAAIQLISLGIGNSNINLVGHSWGTFVAYEIARDCETQIASPGSAPAPKVRSIVALDPANDPSQYGLLGYVANQYYFNSRYDSSTVNFHNVADISWAFYGDSILGSIPLAATADAAFSIASYSGQPGGFNTLLAEHRAPEALFTQLIDQNLPGQNPSFIATLFSPQRLIDNNPVGWHQNAFTANGDRISGAYVPGPFEGMFNGSLTNTINGGDSCWDDSSNWMFGQFQSATQFA